MSIHEKMRRQLIKKTEIASGIIHYKPQEKFDNYYDLFKNLVHWTGVKTESPIISITISYNSNHAITVTKNSDREFKINAFSLNCTHYSKVFEEIVGG